MTNTKVTYNADKDAWTYSPLKYWPNNTGEKVSFFAYAPCELPAGSSLSDYYNIKFTVANDVKDQVDLIYNNQANNSTINQTKPAVGNLITFKFEHALSRIGLSVQVVVDGTETDPALQQYKLDGNTRINVKKVMLVDGTAADETFDPANTTTGPFYTSGTLSMMDGTWSDTDGTQYFTFGSEHFYRTVTDNGEEVVQLTKFNQSQTLLNEDSYLMIIPTENTSFKIYIEYDVITEEEDGTETTINNCILSKNPLSVDFEQGYAYNFNLVLGMTSVQFDVEEVAEWNTTCLLYTSPSPRD